MAIKFDLPEELTADYERNVRELDAYLAGQKLGEEERKRVRRESIAEWLQGKGVKVETLDEGKGARVKGQGPGFLTRLFTGEGAERGDVAGLIGATAGKTLGMLVPGRRDPEAYQDLIDYQKRELAARKRVAGLDPAQDIAAIKRHEFELRALQAKKRSGMATEADARRYAEVYKEYTGRITEANRKIKAGGGKELTEAGPYLPGQEPGKIYQPGPLDRSRRELSDIQAGRAEAEAQTRPATFQGAMTRAAMRGLSQSGGRYINTAAMLTERPVEEEATETALAAPFGPAAPLALAGLKFAPQKVREGLVEPVAGKLRELTPGEVKQINESRRQAAGALRGVAATAEEGWQEKKPLPAGLKLISDVAAGTSDVAATMALSALAGPGAPTMTGALYGASSYDEFVQKAKGEMAPALAQAYIAQGMEPDEAAVKAGQAVEAAVRDKAMLQALLQGGLDAASQYVFMSAFPKVGGAIMGKTPALAGKIKAGLSALKLSPEWQRAVTFMGNWALEHGQEEAQNYGQRALEISAGIKGSGLTPAQEAAEQRAATLGVTGIMSLLGLVGEANLPAEAGAAVTEAAKNPTEGNVKAAIEKVKTFDPGLAGDMERALNTMKASSQGEYHSSSEAEAALGEITNPALREDVRQTVARNIELNKFAFEGDLTGLPNRRVWKKVYDQRREQGWTILRIDGDNTKRLNELYGHDFTDRVIGDSKKAVDAVLKPLGGETYDVSGDETVAALPPGTDAQAAAQALRGKVSELRLDAPDGTEIIPSVTVGIGRPGDVEQNADLAATYAKVKGSGMESFEGFEALPEEEKARVRAVAEERARRTAELAPGAHMLLQNQLLERSGLTREAIARLAGSEAGGRELRKTVAAFAEGKLDIAGATAEIKRLAEERRPAPAPQPSTTVEGGTIKAEADFRAQAERAGWTGEQAEAALGLINARARVKGQEVGEWLGEKGLRIERGGELQPGALTQTAGKEVKGALEVNDGAMVLRAFDKADVSTLVHELGHIFRQDLTDQELKAAQKAFEVENGVWTAEAEEKFARRFELYLRTGEAPTPEVKTFFDKLKSWLTDIYQNVRDSLTDKQRDFYDRMLGKPREVKPRVTFQLNDLNRETLDQIIGDLEYGGVEPGSLIRDESGKVIDRVGAQSRYSELARKLVGRTTGELSVNIGKDELIKSALKALSGETLTERQHQALTEAVGIYAKGQGPRVEGLGEGIVDIEAEENPTPSPSPREGEGSTGSEAENLAEVEAFLEEMSQGMIQEPALGLSVGRTERGAALTPALTRKQERETTREYPKAPKPAVETRLDETEGIGKEGLLSRIGRGLQTTVAVFTRKYRELPGDRFALASDILRRAENANNIGKHRSRNYIRQMTAKLNRAQFKIFSRYAIMNDLCRSIDEGLYRVPAMVAEPGIRVRNKITGEHGRIIQHQEGQGKARVYFRYTRLGENADRWVDLNEIETLESGKLVAGEDQVAAHTLEKPLPFGFSIPEAYAYRNELRGWATSDPQVSQAVAARNKLYKALAVEAGKYGVLAKEHVKNAEAYFHRQVLYFYRMKEEAARPGGEPANLKSYQAGFQKQRTGSSLDYNTNILEADFEVISQMLAKFERKKTRQEIDKAYGLQLKRGQEIPDGYTAWAAKPGSTWYETEGVTDDIMNSFLSELYRQQDKMDAVERAKSMYPEVEKILDGAVRHAAAEDQMIIPVELARTMDGHYFTETRNNPVDDFARRTMTLWKQYVLLNPFRAIKYNLNNFSGDLDIVLAYNPRILKHFPAAVAELWRDARGKGESADVKLARNLGVIDAGITVNEISDINYDSVLTELTGKRDLNVLKAWFHYAREATNFRESLLRLASFKFFRDEIAKGAKPYGASVKAEIDQVNDPSLKAAKLGRELMGDYGNLTEAGNYIRTRMMPFYSWLEINAPRYVRLWQNLAYETPPGTEAPSSPARRGKEGKRSRDIRAYMLEHKADLEEMKGMTPEQILARRSISQPPTTGKGRMAGAAGRGLLGKGVKFAIRAPVKVAQMYLLMGAVNAWNHLVFPDEEKDLTEDQRRQLHVIVGRGKDGSVYTVRFQGALSDALDWFGMADAWYDVQDLMQGKATLREKLTEAGQGIPQKIIQGVRPDVKLFAELLSGKQLWPDAFKPRTIRDRMDYLVGQGGALTSLPYRYLTGKPMRRLGKEVAEALFAYRAVDPGEGAYIDVAQARRKWLEASGKAYAGGEPTERSNALFYYRLAQRYGDKKAEKRYLDKYLDLVYQEAVRKQAAAASRLRSMTTPGLVRIGGPQPVTREGIRKKSEKLIGQSIARSAPLGGVSKADMADLWSRLDDRARAKVERAYDWYLLRMLDDAGREAVKADPAVLAATSRQGSMTGPARILALNKAIKKHYRLEEEEEGPEEDTGILKPVRLRK